MTQGTFAETDARTRTPGAAIIWTYPLLCLYLHYILCKLHRCWPDSVAHVLPSCKLQVGTHAAGPFAQEPLIPRCALKFALRCMLERIKLLPVRLRSIMPSSNPRHRQGQAGYRFEPITQLIRANDSKFLHQRVVCVVHAYYACTELRLFSCRYQSSCMIPSACQHIVHRSRANVPGMYRYLYLRHDMAVSRLERAAEGAATPKRSSR